MTDHKAPFMQELISALSDIGILLEFLGREPDARLQSFFKKARKLNEQSDIQTEPPSKTYSAFLNRISMIQAEYDEKGKISEEGPVGPNGLTNAAFVLWTRDFLSALAAPSTADSIRITNEYMKHRFNKISRNAGDQYEVSAAKTIGTVKWTQNLALITTVGIIVISIYALAGHQILSAKTGALAELKDIDDHIELAQRQDGDDNIVNPALLAYLKQKNMSGSANESDKRQHGKFFLCDNVDITNFYQDNVTPGIHDIGAPSDGPVPSGRYYYYASLDEITLCRNRKTILNKLLALSEELISWQRTITNPLPFLVLQGKTNDENPPAISRQVASLDSNAVVSNRDGTQSQISRNISDNSSPLGTVTKYVLSVPGFLLEHFAGAVLGKPSTVASEFSENQKLCVGFLGMDKCSSSTLMELAEYYGTIPDSILGCINLYILPCLFGFLGSATASVKYIRYQIDKHLLCFTDRGRIVQNLILGVMSGAVIGLFATYLTSSNEVLATLGVSGFAFLSGYNIPGLFRLFDDVSSRVLQSGPKS
jgi:hypothetical protein